MTLRKVGFEPATIHLPALRHSPPHYDGPNIIYDILGTVAVYRGLRLGQVKAKEQELKHKLRPDNTFLKAKDLDLPAACPREELLQFQVLIGLYGEYIIPASLHSYTEVLRAPALYTSPNRPLVSEAKMRGVWARLRDRLSLLDS